MDARSMQNTVRSTDQLDECMTFAPEARGITARSFHALVCLLAMMLLWAPLWANAWRAAPTCNGMMCLAKNHAAAATPRQNDQASEDSDMPTDMQHCEHGAKPSATTCSMSCCHHDLSSLVASMIFDLPALALQSRAPRVVSPVFYGSESEIFSDSVPPDQPPRLLQG